MGKKINRQEVLAPVLESACPIPPIVLDMEGDIDVFRDVESACLHLEVYDLADVFGFDSRGYLLEMLSEGYKVTGMMVSGSEPDPSELRRRLTRFIREIGTDEIGIADPDRRSLQELLDALLRFQERM